MFRNKKELRFKNVLSVVPSVRVFFFSTMEPKLEMVPEIPQLLVVLGREADPVVLGLVNGVFILSLFTCA